MKRLLLFLIIGLATMSITAAAGNVTIENLAKEFASERGAESVTINSFMMKLARMAAGNSSEADILKKINSVKVVDLEDCSADVKTRFAKSVKELEVTGMEELVSASDNGEKVKMYAKMKDDKIRKLLVIVYGGDDCCIVEINGNFSMDELGGVVDSQVPGLK